MTLNKKVKELLDSKQKNRDNQAYLLFNSKNIVRDKAYVEEFLISNLRAMSTMVYSEDKKELAKHIIKTFKRIKAIRLDLADENIPPIKLVVENMKQTHNGQIDKDGAVTLNTDRDGIVIFVPVLEEEIKQNATAVKTQKGTHIALHELVHALSARFEIVEHTHNGKLFKQKVCLTGIRGVGQEKGIFDDLNEGMTEYFTQKILRKRGITYEEKEFYPWRVKLVDAIMQKFEPKQRRKIFTQYITGESDKIINSFKLLENGNSQNLWDYLDENYQQKHRGISGVNSGPILKQDEDVYNEIVEALEDFQISKISNVGSII